MIPKLESAEYVTGYAIRFRFADGSEEVVDLKDELRGEVFEPLKDPSTFRNFRLDHELNTVIWPSGADLAPEFLYEKAVAQQAEAADRLRPAAIDRSSSKMLSSVGCVASRRRRQCFRRRSRARPLVR
jgi:hypothetical protein